ncbi:hypothetical protein HNQ02_000224 [Flavobacterium sp. 7E]|uniref:DUF4249 domain-containing protein n=1 Tax=unclassified Flavobacterium TaxID=196869 RepID=UPI00156F6B6A|nr:MULTISPECIES: DUF4249 domain-containing protein [unclassified Flavobacterium]MBE0391698.1 hypothetical protein [Flavobacterium sp. PL002]NRS87324.1 hypothetical protein [Flavobacterium sp. 7E]
MKYFILVFLAVFFTRCNQDDFDKSTQSESEIVVEGWIESGDYAQVILSTSIPIAAQIDSTTILSHVIRSAKVTISDGENEEVLRLKRNNDRIPPFVYYGSELIGESGKEYSLKIEYLDRIIEAKTAIPKTVPLKTATYIKESVQDTTGYVFITFDDPVLEKNYYQVTTRIDKEEPIFVPAFYGNLNDENFNSSSVSMQINRGILIFPKTKFQPYFTDGDLIYVKLKTLNKEAFDFWNSWQNEIVNGRNPIYPSNTSLKSNIRGGLGLWTGYGQSTIIVKTPSKK